MIPPQGWSKAVHRTRSPDRRNRIRRCNPRPPRRGERCRGIPSAQQPCMHPGIRCSLIAGIRSPLICRSGETEFPQSGNTEFPDAYRVAAPKEYRGTFRHVGEDEDYIVGFYSFYPASAYDEPPWTILVAESSASVFAPLSEFSTYFGLVLLLGVFLAVLISSIQIRRTMEPLDALGAGTQSIADGDLGTRVTVSTTDEFGTLAESFNSMAGNLEAQFI